MQEQVPAVPGASRCPPFDFRALRDRSHAEVAEVCPWGRTDLPASPARRGDAALPSSASWDGDRVKNGEHRSLSLEREKKKLK